MANRRLIRRAAAVLCALALAASAAQQVAALQPVPADSVAAWARYAAGLTRPGLKGDIAAFALPHQRQRVEEARVEIHQRGRSPGGDCRYPTHLAFAEAGADGSRVVLCADNLRALNYAVRQWTTLHLMDKKYYSSWNAPMEHIQLLAEMLHEQRGTDADGLRFPCPVNYFIYLKQRGKAKWCRARTGEGDRKFKLWMDERNGLVDDGLLAAYRAAGPQWSDAQIVDFIEADHFQRVFAQLLVFAVAHEFGHIAHGHLETDATAFCDLYRREKLADEFAFAFLKSRGLPNRSELSLSLFPWLFLGYATRRLSSENSVSESITAARALLITRAFRTEFPLFAQEVPAGTVRDRLLSTAVDPALVRIEAQLAQVDRCEAASEAS
jgi:hypothetical protein